MATVFMKWLEKSPKDYDRGIQLLTLGRIQRIKARIVNDYISPGMHVLEIGCGTGTLTVMSAQAGAQVTGIDASPRMLAEAKQKVAAAGLEANVTLKYLDAAQIGDQFSPASFDLIVSTLVFSELPQEEQHFVLAACQHLLKPTGRLLIADEVVPTHFIKRLLYTLVRLPLVLFTWLLTRTSTTSLRNFETVLAQSGFEAEIAAAYLGGSLVLYAAQPVAAAADQRDHPPAAIKTLHHRVTLRTLLLDVWLLFFRIIPPYPKVAPGLYQVGHPDADSAVLVTGNFDLTVRRLLKAIDHKVNVWLLVADSAGINVWCAAGGGYFTAEKVIAAVKSSHVEQIVRHHALILPQLCANGVDGWRVRQETGWGVHWGPARAADLPAYLAGRRKKTDAMRWVRFPLKDRLEMVTVTLGFYALLILVPVFIFWRDLFWPVTISLLGLSYFYAAVLPWLPGRDGLYKSIPLAVLALAGLFVYSSLRAPLTPLQLFHWSVGLIGLSVFTAAEMQGMSPLMRGEQANWGYEAVIGLALAALYWLVPLAVGWR
ncbi:MAG: corrinoid protein-associated methyltransferase CpaM [Anaerolineales bacterium]